MDIQALFLAKLPAIERLVALRCRSYGIVDQEAEDFASDVKLHLMEHDYKVLRKFRGRGKIETYLAIVITNLAKDHLISRDGKRRPSAAAKRLGVNAVELELLLRYEGYSLDEAIHHLRHNRGVEASEAELHKLAAQLKLRPKRRLEGEEGLQHLADDRSPRDPALDGERTARAQHIAGVLGTALDSLPDAEDRLILRTLFFDGLPIVRIAKSLGLDQRRLYRRIQGCCEKLRRHFEAHDLSAEAVLEVLDWGKAEIAVEW